MLQITLCFIALVTILKFQQSSQSLLTAENNDSYIRIVSEMDKEWVMVERRGNNQFVLNGEPFFAHGFNTYWLMVFAADDSGRQKVTEVFRDAAEAEFNVCRSWAFNDACWRALQISPGVYDEQVFQGLDYVVNEARKHKLKLILSLVNNWEEYGGKIQYVKWGRDAGLNLHSDDDFFSDPTVKGYYKDHVKKILTRVNTLNNITYKDDPTILAWELMNEPRCPSDPSGNTFQAWLEEMASFVKSIDPQHLLEIGVEGFYGMSTPEKLHLNPSSYFGQSGTDFLRNHLIEGIDFASIHVYPDSWLCHLVPESHFDFVKAWIKSHMDDAQCPLGMPVVIGEFGVTLKDQRFDLMFRDAFVKTVYETLWNSSVTGRKGGGCFIWQLFPDGTDHMDDGYALVLKNSTSTLHVLLHQFKRMQVLKEECSSNSFCSKKKEAGRSYTHEEL